MTNVTVGVRGCQCPGLPHSEIIEYPDGTKVAGDVIYVAPTLSLAGGLAAEHDNSVSLAETLANAGPAPTGGWNDDNSEHLAVDMAERLRRRLMLTYVRYGAVGWNFEDESGPVTFDIEVILADYGIAQPVTEKCDELYREAVTRPLLARLAARSQRGRTGRSTSANGTTTKRPRPSSRVTSAATKPLSA